MEPTEQNRRAWDEIHRRRAEAMSDHLGIPEPIRERLPGLAGRHVLHLQCGTGEATAELAAADALVTAVDLSSDAIAVARERVPSAAFVQADVHAIPLELRRGRFDLVYTGGGVLRWIQDLDAWAGGLTAALRAGGELLLYDAHPVVECLDAALRWRRDYFDDDPIVGAAVDPFHPTSEPAGEERHERFWRLGQIVSALAGAGLVVRSLEEFSSIHHWRRQDPRVPGEFVLRARKP